jgi:NADH-quinone oxidoreductase subunit G
MPKLTINGKEIEVAAGTNLIEAAKQIATEIPHFCYHPGLSVAGNCRMCLVEIEKAPKLQIACNTPVAEGMVVFTDSDKVKKARAGVMEFLLLNHPIDCPICDCAGECYLQDYYMDYDLKGSRLEEGKNKKEKAQDIGEHVMLDKERCVLCSRCVRFTDEVSKTHELGIFGRGSTEEIGLFPGTTLNNAYSGCVVDICPVGALTDKDFRFKSRPWFLKETETVCAGCAMGCNVVLNTNTNPYNKVGQLRSYRMFPRENAAVNQHWMCDEGRYSHKELDIVRKENATLKGLPSTLDYALALAVADLQPLLATPAKIAFLLSPQLTNEELFAYKWLAKELGVAQVEVGDDLKKTGSSDNYLIKTDKNPNSRGAEDQGLAPRSGVLGGKALLEKAAAGEFSAVLVVEQSLDAPQAQAIAGKAKLIGLHAQLQAADKSYHYAFARAAYAEQDGTFTNIQGRVQRVRKAMDALGEGLNGWQFAFKLAQALGKTAPAKDAAGIFALLAKEAKGYSALTWDGLGKQGALVEGAQVAV